MGWFDGFFGDGSWVGPLISAAGTVAGAVISSNANTKAAREVAESNELAQQRFEDVQEQTQPGVDYQLSLLRGGGSALTPEQQRSVDDARRSTLNALSVSGLRGSGRATTAAVRDVEEKTTDRFLAANRKRADTAATSLAKQNFSTVTPQAILDVNAGENAADAEVAEASLRGGALADIATVINDTVKEGRKSRRATEAAPWVDPDREAEF